MQSVQYLAQQLTDQTNRPDERSAIIATIASLQTNLAEVIHTTDQMTDELIKAMEPWKQHQSAKEAVERWLDQGVDTVKPTLSLGNMPTVLRQLQEHRVSESTLAFSILWYTFYSNVKPIYSSY